jgi:cytoskeletal protein CcmA (bactofilin family)
MDGIAQSGIGKSLVIKGEITANEPLLIGGRVEGQIDVRDNKVTILEGGEVRANVIGKNVVVLGTLIGGVEALERLEMAENSSIEGDLSAPRISMAAGARFTGSVEMPKRK